MPRLVQRHEFMLFIVTVLVSAAIGAANPAFFSAANLFDLAKSSVTLGILALGVLVVLVSGGIDVSFPAIATACMYITCTLAIGADRLNHLSLLLACSAGISRPGGASPRRRDMVRPRAAPVGSRLRP